MPLTGEQALVEEARQIIQASASGPLTSALRRTVMDKLRAAFEFRKPKSEIRRYAVDEIRDLKKSIEHIVADPDYLPPGMLPWRLIKCQPPEPTSDVEDDDGAAGGAKGSKAAALSQQDARAQGGSGTRTMPSLGGAGPRADTGYHARGGAHHYTPQNELDGLLGSLDDLVFSVAEGPSHGLAGTGMGAGGVGQHASMRPPPGLPEPPAGAGAHAAAAAAPVASMQEGFFGFALARGGGMSVDEVEAERLKNRARAERKAKERADRMEKVKQAEEAQEAAKRQADLAALAELEPAILTEDALLESAAGPGAGGAGNAAGGGKQGGGREAAVRDGKGGDLAPSVSALFDTGPQPSAAPGGDQALTDVLLKLNIGGQAGGGQGAAGGPSGLGGSAGVTGGIINRAFGSGGFGGGGVGGLPSAAFYTSSPAAAFVSVPAPVQGAAAAPASAAQSSAGVAIGGPAAGSAGDVRPEQGQQAQQGGGAQSKGPESAPVHHTSTQQQQVQAIPAVQQGLPGMTPSVAALFAASRQGAMQGGMQGGLPGGGVSPAVHMQAHMAAQQQQQHMQYMQLMQAQALSAQQAQQNAAAAVAVPSVDVFVSGFFSTVTALELYTIMKGAGKVLSVRMMLADVATNRGAGSAYVHFETREAASKAVAILNGRKVPNISGDSPLSLSLAQDPERVKGAQAAPGSHADPGQVHAAAGGMHPSVAALLQLPDPQHGAYAVGPVHHPSYGGLPGSLMQQQGYGAYGYAPMPGYPLQGMPPYGYGPGPSSSASGGSGQGAHGVHQMQQPYGHGPWPPAGQQPGAPR